MELVERATNAFVGNAPAVRGGPRPEPFEHVGSDRTPTVDELLSVLARKLARDREELARVALFLSTLGEVVDATEVIDVLADEPDRCWDACWLPMQRSSQEADRAMLRLGTFHGVRIGSPGNCRES